MVGKGVLHGDFRRVVRTVRDCPQGLLRVLIIMVIMTDLAALVLWVQDTGGATPMSKRRSYLECCLTLPVGTWSVARTQSIRSVGGHVHNLTTSYFERKESKFVSNKTAIYRQNCSSLCILFVKLAPLCVYSSFIRPITYAKASREHAFDAGGSTKLKPQQRRQWGGVNVRQKNQITQILKLPKIWYRFVRLLWLCHAQLRDLVEVWALTDECSPPVGKCSPQDRTRSISFVQTFVNFRSKFAWALPLSLSSPWTMIFFSETTNTDKKWKLVPNAPLPRWLHRTWSMWRGANPNHRVVQDTASICQWSV